MAFGPLDAVVCGELIGGAGEMPTELLGCPGCRSVGEFAVECEQLLSDIVVESSGHRCERIDVLSGDATVGQQVIDRRRLTECASTFGGLRRVAL